MRRLGADDKCPLSESVEQRLTAFDVVRGAGGDNEELARPGGFRIPEHRRRDIALPATGVLGRETRRGGRADRAHRKMNGAPLQSRCETLDAGVSSSERDLASGGVVGHHADDDRAVVEIGEFRRGVETEGGELVHLVRATDIGGHPMASRDKVCGHRRAHAAKTDKADLAVARQAAGRGAADPVELSTRKRNRIGHDLSFAALPIAHAAIGAGLRPSPPTPLFRLGCRRQHVGLIASNQGLGSGLATPARGMRSPPPVSLEIAMKTRFAR